MDDISRAGGRRRRKMWGSDEKGCPSRGKDDMGFVSDSETNLVR
jgi:hypothetical protein